MTEYKLKELLEIKNGRDYKHLSDGNVPMYGSGGLMRYVNEALYQGESILLPRKGTLTNIQYVNESFWTVDTIYYSIINIDKAVPYFLYYYLKQLDLSHLNSGTGVPSMTFGAYYDIPVKLPELESQQQIAKVLSDLDAKIELNNKINAELEAMAKLIYDYWFVQFDFPSTETPLSRGAGGVLKPYKTSGGKMVYNQELKREIPEGWEVKELKELAHLKAGGDKPKELSETPNDRFKVPIYSNGVTDEGLYGYAEEPKVEEPSFTISARGTIGYSVLRMKPFVPIIRLISVTPKNQKFLKFLHERIKMLNFDDSGSVQKQLTVPMISSLKLVVPAMDTLSHYSSLTFPWINKIENNQKENQKLSELRDWLLPMLMNGQVKVG